MSAAPNLSQPTVTQYVRQLVGKRDGSRVLALKGAPKWDGPEHIEMDGESVVVRPCQSSLAVRSALVGRQPDDFLVIITDQDAEQLGESVVMRFQGQRIVVVDPWTPVAALFSARSVSSGLKGLGVDLAEALAAHRPPAGYPAAPAGIVTSDIALGSLVASVIGVPRSRLDIDQLLSVSAEAAAKEDWRVLAPSVRRSIADWSREGIGFAAPAVLGVMSSVTRLDAVTIGLACDALMTPRGPREAAKAQGRLEGEHGLKGVAADDLRALARVSVNYVKALPPGDPRRAALPIRAEQLLDDIGWPEGAQSSRIMPAGYTARLHKLAASLADYSQDPNVSERLLDELMAHESAGAEQAQETDHAQMAVRLARWLATDDGEPEGLEGCLRRQIGSDAWVDRALADVFTGSGDPMVSQAYEGLAVAAQSRRKRHDEQFAKALVETTKAGTTAHQSLVVEDVLRRLVAPMAELAPILMIVVDGMSAGVATEVLEGATQRGWVELITGDGRQPVVAGIPTVTRFSRTSLLTGSLRDGGQHDEKVAFSKVFAKGQVFHKDDLRAGAGHHLPEVVRRAIESDARAIAVVLNTVDDALAKADPDGMEWNLSTIQHLGPLLDLATRSGRTVILTSDHGHVVERGSKRIQGSDAEARYRLPNGDLHDGEVLIAGDRVMIGEKSVFVPWREDIRYGSKSAGYHGGISAAEVTIPFAVITRNPEALNALGWVAAPPLAPEWWVEAPPASSNPAARQATPAPKPKPQPVHDDQADLYQGDVLSEPAKPESQNEAARRIAERVVSSPAFSSARKRGRRVPIGDGVVIEVIACVLARGGRAHSDVVAKAAGWPAFRMKGALPSLQRLLNTQGYQVIAMDADEVTIVIDERLLRDQFGLGR